MSSEKEDPVGSLQAQLAECRAQAEHWQGVATICELSKQEELAELQKQCDEEIQSLQEALRATVAQYEARIAVLQSQPVDWRRTSGHNTTGSKKGRAESDVSVNESLTSVGNSLKEDEAASPPDQTRSGPLEPEAAAEDGSPLSAEGYYSLQNCDSASLSSFSLDTPSLPRKLLTQEDTESLVSTGTLVPEAIYLPPAGHRLVTHSDWDALNAQLSDLRGEVSRLQAEKEELERELDTQTHHTHKQVSLLQSQVQTSETLLQDLQKSFSQSQNAVQSRLAELSLSQRKMCCELSRLKGEDIDERLLDPRSSISDTQQGAHCEERLRIEIVNLREQLDSRAEENDVLEVQLSTLRTETEKIQAQRDQQQAELFTCRKELEAQRVALTHLQNTNKALTSDKALLHQQCLELRSQVISLRSQVDTSQAVQRDFVELSQSLQVKLELIRQAETLEQVKEILGESVGEAGAQPAEVS
ncbi:rab GTPase-binding effector protein 2 [Cyprinodon tularosa]|uniref:rab GTPase-binding effector protein 2 n=1 Tax=Cyprinodon variegatus TaxID=28743 RepID=UPI000742CA14|nr:PREDICTED: rab GTPase-binding effector protein 2 [Cyprinodon variegatus]XP_038138159.1 rab GTPase-binding effector protein 2 [Cyprinodon tularosa]